LVRWRRTNLAVRALVVVVGRTTAVVADGTGLSVDLLHDALGIFASFDAIERHVELGFERLTHLRAHSARPAGHGSGIGVVLTGPHAGWVELIVAAVAAQVVIIPAAPKDGDLRDGSGQSTPT